MKNIILIGMMGCGKTTVGGLLAQRLGREQVDTDACIETEAGRSVSELFQTEGEDGFRARELELSKELGRRSDRIVSCGGGLPLRADAIGALRESGIVFWLDRDPAETYEGLDVTVRPLAQEGKAAFVARYAQRVPIYRAAAHHTVRADCAQQAADMICSILEQEGEL